MRVDETLFGQTIEFDQNPPRIELCFKNCLDTPTEGDHNKKLEMIKNFPKNNFNISGFPTYADTKYFPVIQYFVIKGNDYYEFQLDMKEYQNHFQKPEELKVYFDKILATFEFLE